jgi:hypothetical protein
VRNPRQTQLVTHINPFWPIDSMTSSFTWKNDRTENWKLARFVITSSQLVNEIVNGAQIKLEELSESRYRTFDQAIRDEQFITSAQAIYTNIKNEWRFEYDTEIAYDPTTNEQWIRSHDVIRKNHLKTTCLDMSLLVASCFARAGIPPIVIVIDGHAFLAFRTTTQISTSPEISLQEIDSLIRNGHMQPLESTFLAVGNPFADCKLDFECAIKFAKDNLQKVTPDSFTCAVDIFAAWESGVERIHEKEVNSLSLHSQTIFAEDLLTKAENAASNNDWENAVNIFDATAAAAKDQRNRFIERIATIREHGAIYQYCWQNRISAKHRIAEFRMKLQRMAELIKKAQNIGVERLEVLHMKLITAHLRRNSGRTISLARSILKLSQAIDTRNDYRITNAINFGLEASMQNGKVQGQAYFINASKKQEKISLDSDDFENAIFLIATRILAELGCQDSVEERLRLLQSFCHVVDASARNRSIAFRIIKNLVERLAGITNARKWRSETILLMQSLYKSARQYASSLDLILASSQIAELYSEANDSVESTTWFSRSKSHLNDLRAEQDPRVSSLWASWNVNLIMSRGRIDFRLGKNCKDYEERKGLFNRAIKSFSDAIASTESDKGLLQGNIIYLQADAFDWLGKCYGQLGLHDKAADYYAKCNGMDGLQHRESFWKTIGSDALSDEIRARLLSGDIARVKNLILRGKKKLYLSNTAASFIKHTDLYINQVLDPFSTWMEGEDAQSIRRDGLESISTTIASIVKPLFEWWSMTGVRGFEFFFDFWGRGAFARIASAVKAAPYNAIAVDASSIQDIRYAARVFCPIFETVIVKWKGPLASSINMASVTLPECLHDIEFGGHGYCYFPKSGSTFSELCFVGNFLSDDVVQFVAGEAAPLIRRGRLVLLPAPLIGCTQSSFGWSDDLLLNTFLSGVVATCGVNQTRDARDGTSCGIPLITAQIPFIDLVPLDVLSDCLDLFHEYARPFRNFLSPMLQSGELASQNWASLARFSRDFQDALGFFRDRLKGRVAMRLKYPLNSLSATVTASERCSEMPGSEVVTDILRSVCPIDGDRAPFVIYWQLLTNGGRFEWTCPLDNQNPVPKIDLSFDDPFNTRFVRGWLVPGDCGMGVVKEWR